MQIYVNVLQTYMSALGMGDFATIKALFTPDARVNSPFLGEMPAEDFFEKLADFTSESIITPIDIFLSTTDRHQATAYFRYDWTLKDGTQISFKVMDLFSFAANDDRVTRLDLIYDTHPIRSSVGNKFQ